MQTSVKRGSFQPFNRSATFTTGPVHSRRFQTFKRCAQFKTFKFRRPEPIPPREFSDETKNQETSKTLATSHRPRH